MGAGRRLPQHPWLVLLALRRFLQLVTGPQPPAVPQPPSHLPGMLGASSVLVSHTGAWAQCGQLLGSPGQGKTQSRCPLSACLLCANARGGGPSMRITHSVRSQSESGLAFPAGPVRIHHCRPS